MFSKVPPPLHEHVHTHTYLSLFYFGSWWISQKNNHETECQVWIRYFVFLLFTIQHRQLLSSNETHLSIISSARTLFTFPYRYADHFLYHLLRTAAHTLPLTQNSVKWKIDVPPARGRSVCFVCTSLFPSLSLSLYSGTKPAQCCGRRTSSSQTLGQSCRS